MADHVRTLRKRLERMERAQAQNTGRPVNQRDKALAEALRAGIAALEKDGDAPRTTGKHPALGAPYGELAEALKRTDRARKYATAAIMGCESALGMTAKDYDIIRANVGKPQFEWPTGFGKSGEGVGILRPGEVAARLSEPCTGIIVQGRDIDELKKAAQIGDIDRDEHMDRDYIPFGGGWEVHTKGKGSTFRLVHVKPDEKNVYTRYAVCDNHLHEPLRRMAVDVRDAILRAYAAGKAGVS